MAFNRQICRPKATPAFSNKLQNLPNFPCNLLTLTIRKEILLKMLASQSASYQFRIKVFQNICQRTISRFPHFIQDPFIFLHKWPAFFRISLSALLAEKLFKNILKIQLSAPSKTFSIWNGKGISVVDLSECVSIPADPRQDRRSRLERNCRRASPLLLIRSL